MAFWKIGDPARSDVPELVANAAKETGVESSIHPDDHIFNFLINHPLFRDNKGRVDYYFRDGCKSAEQFEEIVARYLPDRDNKVHVLEFASGYGCVTRHLKKSAMLDLVACDIHDAAIGFLENELGVKAVRSHSQPEKLDAGGAYDVVFALSFFSHMPIWTWTRWMVALTRKVRKGGLLVMTTQGETSKQHFVDCDFGLNGFYFERTSEQKDLPLEEYGNTVVTDGFVRKVAGSIPQIEEIELRLGYWWGHQDLFIYRKVGDL